MIKQNIIIENTTAKEVYETLLDSNKHTALIGDSAIIEPNVGGSFSAFSGYATGEILQLEENKRIKLKWRASNWVTGMYSTIEFNFSDKEGGAVIDFIQDDLPAGTEAEFESGWEDFYWAPMKRYFS